MNEVVKNWRKREATKGGRSLTVWMYPKTVQMLNDLKNNYRYAGEGRNVILIARAIEKLHADTFGEDE